MEKDNLGIKDPPVQVSEARRAGVAHRTRHYSTVSDRQEGNPRRGKPYEAGQPLTSAGMEGAGITILDTWTLRQCLTPLTTPPERGGDGAHCNTHSCNPRYLLASFRGLYHSCSF